MGTHKNKNNLKIRSKIREITLSEIPWRNEKITAVK